MFLDSSNCANHSFIPEVHEPEHLMRGTNALDESSNHMGRPSRDILAQEAEIMDTWTQVLEDHDHQDVANENWDTEIEEEESEIDRELAETMEYPTQGFVTRC